MEFISNEAVEDGPLVFSDNEEEEKITDEQDNFIDNGPQSDEDVSFYRQLDHAKLDNYLKFHGQTLTLSRQFVRTILLFMIMGINSLNFTLQKIESLFLLTSLRGLKNLSKNLKRL